MVARNLKILIIITLASSSAFAQTKQTKKIIDSIDKLIAASLEKSAIEGIAYAQ